MSVLNLIPFLLPVLFIILIPQLFYAKRAIVMGNWSAHKNRMVMALVLWLVAMLLLLAFLLRNGFSNLFAAHNLLFVIYGVVALLTSIMIALTLLKVLKHLYLPHKMLARKTIYVWSATSLLGALVFLYSIVMTGYI